MSSESEAKKSEGKSAKSPKRGGMKSSSSNLAPAVNDTIGRRLEAHYRALAAEPLPDRFLVLLAELRAKELKK